MTDQLAGVMGSGGGVLKDRSFVSNKRIVAAAITAWLVSMPLGGFIHHGLLGKVFSANAAAFRPAAEILRRLPIGYAVGLIGFIAVAFLYARLHPQAGTITDGARFGALLGVILVSFAAVWNYITQPISPAAGVAEVFEYLLESTIYGAIIGAIARPRAG